MNSRIASLMIAALVFLLGSSAARADWDTEGERRAAEAAYVAGQSAEKAGRLPEALNRYAQAQAVPNANAVAAARRAAQIAPGLAAAEEKQGNHAQAATYYDQGGQFAAADRAFMASLRAKLDTPGAVGSALTYFDDRAHESFKGNRKVQFEVNGPYTPDAGLIQEVRGALAKGPGRTLEREAAAFNAQYLQERIALVRARSEVTDVAGSLAAAERERAFLQKWPDDLVKKSLVELGMLREWSQVERNPGVQASIEAQLLKRAEERAGALSSTYAGAPELLDAAKDYASVAHYLKPAEPRIASIKTLANKLGDEAEVKGQLGLAGQYFQVADERNKKQAVQKRQEQLAMQKAQPDIDAAKRTAEAMRAQFNDPAAIEAMRKQALAAQAAMQAQRSGERTKRDAGDLQKDLGLK